MEEVKQNDFNDRFRDQTKKMALEIVLFYSELESRTELRMIGNQLIRSATSVAANFRAACRARSKAEHFSKLCIVVEECDETVFWLDLINSTGLCASKNLPDLLDKSTKLLAAFAKSRKTLKYKSKGI